MQIFYVRYSIVLFFKSNTSAKTLGRDVILYAVYFPSPFSFPYTKVASTLSPQCRNLFSLLLNCMQNDVTSKCLSWSIGLKKAKTILLCPSLPSVKIEGQIDTKYSMYGRAVPQIVP